MKWATEQQDSGQMYHNLDLVTPQAVLISSVLAGALGIIINNMLLNII